MRCLPIPIMFQGVEMSNDRPTSVSVVAWFFIIIGALSVISAIGYIVVSMASDNVTGSALVGALQIVIAGFAAYSGYGLLRGSSVMRQALEILSYLLVLALGVYGVILARDFSSWGPLVNSGLYIVLFAFVIRGLRVQKMREYASKT